jgi:hypothetical protein
VDGEVAWREEAARLVAEESMWRAVGGGGVAAGGGTRPAKAAAGGEGMTGEGAWERVPLGGAAEDGWRGALG